MTIEELTLDEKAAELHKLIKQISEEENPGVTFILTESALGLTKELTEDLDHIWWQAKVASDPGYSNPRLRVR